MCWKLPAKQKGEKHDLELICNKDLNIGGCHGITEEFGVIHENIFLLYLITGLLIENWHEKMNLWLSWSTSTYSVL